MTDRGLARTGTNALPDIDTLSFRVPDATLGEHVPVDVELPDTRCIADDGRHGVDRWMGNDLRGGRGRAKEAGRVVRE